MQTIKDLETRLNAGELLYIQTATQYLFMWRGLRLNDDLDRENGNLFEEVYHTAVTDSTLSQWEYTDAVRISERTIATQWHTASDTLRTRFAYLTKAYSLDDNEQRLRK